MKKLRLISLLTILILSFAACDNQKTQFIDISAASESSLQSDDITTGSNNRETTSVTTTIPIAVEYDGDDLNSVLETGEATTIRLEVDSITYDGTGANVNDRVVTLTMPRMYTISGTLEDGQIVVDSQEDGTVTIIFNGVDISNNNSAAVYIKNSDKTVITLADGTNNFISDGPTYVYDDEEAQEPDAALFSKDDLTISGNGSLTVNANFNNGIASKDDLKITGGSITVNAANDGIKGKDLVAVMDGVVTIHAGADGVQSTNADDTEKGNIVVDGGTLNITSGLDGIQAENRLVVNNGQITINSGSGGFDKDSDSAKALKAGVDITIMDGVVTVEAADDAVHSNGSISINGGNLTLASSDDGMHADALLEINGGDIQITRSYEGIESALITLNNGTIHLAASDDGINASSGGGAEPMFGQPGQNGFETGNNALYINGGYIYVDANGDGIDVNGAIQMTGGVVIVNGPTNNGNGPLDYLGEFMISGGFIVAAGSSGMAQAPSATSTQYSVIQNFTSTQAANTTVHIESEDGEDILTFVPTKEYQSVVVSSPELENGATYNVYVGGSSSGEELDGLYTDGDYSPGTQIASFTISGIVTGQGAGMGGFGGPGGGGGGRPGGPGGAPPDRPQN